MTEVQELDPATRRITVHNPIGYPPKVTAKQMATRLESLEGKTLALLDCRFDNSDAFMEELRGWFARNMPGVTTKIMQMKESWEADPDTLRRIRAEADAAIAGVGL